MSADASRYAREGQFVDEEDFAFRRCACANTLGRVGFSRMSDTDRPWCEIYDLSAQLFVRVLDGGAKQRVAVAGERCVDLLPVFFCQMITRQGNQLVLLGSHVIPVKGCIGLHGIGKRRKLRRASVFVSLQCLAERADFLGTRAMLR